MKYRVWSTGMAARLRRAGEGASERIALGDRVSGMRGRERRYKRMRRIGSRVSTPSRTRIAEQRHREIPTLGHQPENQHTASRSQILNSFAVPQQTTTEKKPRYNVLCIMLLLQTRIAALANPRTPENE